MSEMFGLPEITKGIFPYDYYTMELYIENLGNIDEAMKFLPHNTKQEFIESLKAVNTLIDNETFDMYKFCLFYCS